SHQWFRWRYGPTIWRQPSMKVALGTAISPPRPANLKRAWETETMMKKSVLAATAASTLVTGAQAASDSGYAAGGLILFLIGLALYFAPTIVACIRGKANGTAGVFVVNLLLGWSIVGWFVAFIWACSGETSEQVAKRDQQHRELLLAVGKT